jgi:hypothetical protein
MVCCTTRMVQCLIVHQRSLWMSPTIRRQMYGHLAAFFMRCLLGVERSMMYRKFFSEIKFCLAKIRLYRSKTALARTWTTSTTSACWKTKILDRQSKTSSPYPASSNGLESWESLIKTAFAPSKCQPTCSIKHFKTCSLNKISKRKELKVK